MTDSDCSVVEEKSRHRHKKSKKAVVEKVIEEKLSSKSKHSEKKKSKDISSKYTSDNESIDEKRKAKKRNRKDDDEVLQLKTKKKQKVGSKPLVSESADDAHEHKTNERQKESRRKDDILNEESKIDKDDKKKEKKTNKPHKKNFNNSSEESDNNEKQGRIKSSEKDKRREDKFPEKNKQNEHRETRDQRNHRNNKGSAYKELQNDSKYEDDYRDGQNRTSGHSYGNNKYDDTSSHDNRNMDNYSGNEEGGKPLRYWSSSRGPIRKNSDSYWNKYSDRLKETFDHMEVGPRYYGSGDDKRKEKSSSNRRNDKKIEDLDQEKEAPSKEAEPPKPKKTVDILLSRTGGAYIPPAKLRMMQESITDKSSAAYQRLAWEALKKSIQGHINKVNISNLDTIWRQVLKENIVRGKGLLCRALIQAQAASPSFTNVYASFASILNAKFPKVGELLLKRLVVQFRRGFKRNDKSICITAVTFIAHLVNQEVAHEIIALEILTLLIESPTDDSIEVAIAFLKESGMKLNEVSRKGLTAIFDMLRNILHEGKLEKRVQYMIEVVFQIRKEEFKAHPSVIPELAMVGEDDRIQHLITLEENHDPEDILNVFRLDPDYEANEARYKSLVEDDLDSENDNGEGSDGSGDSDSGSEDDDEAEEGGEKKDVIVDKTETNLVALRKTIYLTIQSSLDFEECAHKLLRMELKPGQEIEMAHMFLDCCAEQRTYEKFFGLLSQRFCQINRVYIAPFEQTFRDSYETIHRMSNDKLRNVGKLFAHLLFTDAISWDVLAIIRLNEDETTSSSRIFIKILFLELSEYMGLAKLNQRVKDPVLQTALEGLFPRDNPKHTRFAINFFTSIGLGGLTDELREHLKSQPKPAAVPQLVEDLSSTSSSSDSSSESSDSSDSSSSSSSSDSSSDSEDNSKKRKNKRKPKKVENKKKPAMTKDKSKSSSRSSLSKKNSKDNSSSRRKRER